MKTVIILILLCLTAGCSTQKVDSRMYSVFSKDLENDYGTFSDLNKARATAKVCNCIVQEKQFDSLGLFIQSKTINE